MCFAVKKQNTFYILPKMKKIILTLFLLLLTAVARGEKEPVTLHTTSGDIYGELILPQGNTPCPVVLIIAGSGPTDRDGNTIGTNLKNNSLLYLAEALAERGIATLRYDKRGIGESTGAAANEEDLRFEHYIDDAVAWADLLGADSRFTSVTIAGHSEGSLIGMVASARSEAVSRFISIAGAGRPAYEILDEQLSRQPEEVRSSAAAINSELRNGNIVEDVPAGLAALYRKSVQPYLISWFRYNPAEEIAKLHIPVLILQGDKDIQVSTNDAEKLRMARIFSSYYIIENMNHVLKECSSNDILSQMQTYQNPDLPIKEELVEHIVRFITN